MPTPTLTQLCETAWPQKKGYTQKQKEWLDKLVHPLYREITYLHYMQEALVQMLGPKGREVWKMWQDQGLVCVHSSWAVDPMTLEGEVIAQTHLDIEAAPKTLVENVDDRLENVHYLSPHDDEGGRETNQD